MKKNLQDLSEEKRPKEKISAGHTGKIGNILKFVSYVIIACIIFLAIYYLTHISNQTYYINVK